MSDGAKPSDGSLLRRWARLKTEARQKEKSPAAAKSPDIGSPMREDPVPAETATARDAQLAAAAAGANPVPGAPEDPLPPVESLTIDSDFSAFMQPKVDEALKRRALRQLFRDPHFNVMDGLDVYIDDYTKSDPIPPEIVREMVQGRYIFNPPPTRINAQGNVEDIPEEEVAALEREATEGPLEGERDAEAIDALPTAPTQADGVADRPPSDLDAAVVTPPVADADSEPANANGDSAPMDSLPKHSAAR